MRRAADAAERHLVDDHLELAPQAPMEPQTSSAPTRSAGTSRRCCRGSDDHGRDEQEDETRRRATPDQHRSSRRYTGSRELVDDADEEPPESLDGRNADTLVGRVRGLDLRAEREHVEGRATLSPITAVSSPACTAVTIGGSPKSRS